MNEEKDFRILYSLVALGVLVVSAITAYFHSMLALPLAVVGLIFIPFILVQDKEKYAHIAELAEKAMFFITLAIIIIAFIWIYTPMKWFKGVRTIWKNCQVDKKILSSREKNFIKYIKLKLDKNVQNQLKRWNYGRIILHDLYFGIHHRSHCRPSFKL